MQDITYQTFNGDWKNSFIVRDILGHNPQQDEESRSREYEKYYLVTTRLDENDTPKSILEFVKLAIAASADAIVLDYSKAYDFDCNFIDLETFSEQVAKPLFEMMKSAGYTDTKSYEHRFSFARI